MLLDTSTSLAVIWGSLLSLMYGLATTATGSILLASPSASTNSNRQSKNSNAPFLVNAPGMVSYFRFDSFLHSYTILPYSLCKMLVILLVLAAICLQQVGKISSSKVRSQLYTVATAMPDSCKTVARFWSYPGLSEKTRLYCVQNRNRTLTRCYAYAFDPTTTNTTANHSRNICMKNLKGLQRPLILNFAYYCNTYSLKTKYWGYM